MTLENREDILDRLIDFQSIVRGHITESRKRTGLAEVSHSTPADTIYQIDTEVDTLVEEFCRAVASNLRANIHVELLYGRDGHHIAEAIFKGLARALREACEIDPRVKGIPSTKDAL